MKSNSIINIKSINPRSMVMVIALLVIGLFFHIATDGIFLSAANITNLIRQSSIVGILAVGLLLVIVSGNIDLSVGSLVGFLGGIASLLFMKAGMSLTLAIIITLSIGFIAGCVQGALTAYLKIPAFIVTLGGLLIFRGAIMALMKGETISVNESFQNFGSGFLPFSVSIILMITGILFYTFYIFNQRRILKKFGLHHSSLSVSILKIVALSSFLIFFLWVFSNQLIQTEKEAINTPIRVPPESPLASTIEYQTNVTISNQVSDHSTKSIPIPVIVMAVLAIAIAIISQFTVFGRRIFAIGGNAEAAWLSGINVKLNTMLVFGLCGLLCAVAGIVYTARLGSASPDAAAGYELYAIAACVIGGTSLMGGRGTVFGAIIGALIMASLDSGMSILNIEPFFQNIIKGVVLISAVYIDVASKR